MTDCIPIRAHTIDAWLNKCGEAMGKRVERALSVMTQHLPQGMAGTVHMWWAFRCVFYVVAATVLIGRAQAPVEHALVRHVLQYMDWAGPGLLFGYPAGRVVADWKRKRPVEWTVFVGSMVACYALLGAALWTVDRCGDALYAWVAQEPAQCLGLVVTLWIVRQISLYVESPAWGNRKGAGGGGVASSAVPVSAAPVSDRMRWVTAAHEAGHLLVYAPLRNRPHKLRAEVFGQSRGGVLGAVSCDLDDYQRSRDPVVEWYMLVCQGGRMGEKVVNGEITMGGESDQQKWLNAAIAYLANHPERGIYYMGETTQQQHQNNDRMIRELAEVQSNMLARYFHENLPLLRELTQALYERGKLAQPDVNRYLDRAVIHEEMPRPDCLHNAR